MPEVEETPEVESAPGSPESEPSTFDDAAEAAQKDLVSSEAEPTETAPTVEETKVDETDPEHIAWAKSIAGHYDPEKGFDSERITKQAFELNKQNQQQAENLKQLKEAFQNPEIAEVFRKVYLQGDTSKAPEPTDKPDEEKTSEEILTEFVNKQFKENFQEVEPKFQAMYGNWLESQYESTYKTLKGEFSNYDEIRDQINVEIGKAAEQAGTTSANLLEFLAQKGRLLDTLRSAARNIVFPTLQEKVTTQDKVKEELEKKKRAVLPGPGSPSSVVEKGIVEKMSFDDAMAAAEKELAVS